MGSTGRGRCAEFGGCGYFESLRLCACPPDLILGGNGNDAVVGGRWNDTALLGSGDDAFGWDPGDGNDTVEGEAGFDRLVFDGANLNENIDISANGSRVRLFRDVGNITMDLNGVERIDVRALGGADNIVINDLSGTDLPPGGVLAVGLRR